MRLTEILKPQNIKMPLEAKVKTDAIGELVQLLADNGELTVHALTSDGLAEIESVVAPRVAWVFGEEGATA